MMQLHDALPVILALPLGFAAGVLFFSALAINTAMYLEGGQASRAIALHVVRLLGIGALFFAAAQFGAGPLLAMLVGFLIARAVKARNKPGNQQGAT